MQREGMIVNTERKRETERERKRYRKRVSGK